MAISKTQPMRSAEIEILDKVNELDIAVDSNTTSLGLLTDALGAEVSDRQLADTALGNRISDEAGARANADTEIMNVIGSGFSSLNTVKSNIEDLQGFDSRFRIGMTEAYTIAASGAQSVLVTFSNPYEATDAILAIINPVASTETLTTLECVLDSADSLGLRATINNSDPENAYTVALGFIAVKVN